MHKFRPILLASLATLVISSQSAQAQGYAPYGNGPMPYANANPYQNYNGNNNFFNNGPFGGNMPFNNNYGQYRGNNMPFNQNNGPFGGNNMPFNNSNGPFGGNNMPFTGNSSFGERFWPGRGSYYDDVLPANGPWNRSWGRAPWNRDYDNLWGRKGGPSNWFNPGDPKEGVAQAWEDMLVTPNALGTMPGGWKAPSISVPNPIDVGDEFKEVAKDMPSEMQNFSEGFTYGEDEGYSNNNPDRGGISFNPGNRR